MGAALMKFVGGAVVVAGLVIGIWSEASFPSGSPSKVETLSRLQLAAPAVLLVGIGFLVIGVGLVIETLAHRQPADPSGPGVQPSTE